eukprot:2351779-Prymnesium_polylepis.1
MGGVAGRPTGLGSPRAPPNMIGIIRVPAALRVCCSPDKMLHYHDHGRLVSACDVGRGSYRVVANLKYTPQSSIFCDLSPPRPCPPVGPRGGGL